MQNMYWLDTHLGSIDEAIKIANQLKWDISIVQNENEWYVMTGEAEKATIFSADSREAVDAFLYGMGLAYIGIPETAFDNLVKEVKKWHERL